jgi:glycine/D-amino acid oxidase-like deaminating enzyme
MHRRSFLQNGLAACLLGGSLSRVNAGSLRLLGITPLSEPPCPDTGALPRRFTSPVLRVGQLPPPTMVGGFPFAPGFFGDSFDNTQIPFHSIERPPELPVPSEDVPLVVIGGGLSGLATAYLLRQHRPVVFELHDRFGGTSQGEEWSNARYSLGGAYFITPDKDTFLERLYRELGADRAHRLDAGGNPVEVNGVISTDFWDPHRHQPLAERTAFKRYTRIVSGFANDTYPDIPLPKDADNKWILELDARSFRDDLEARMAMPIPASLAAALQAYFYSSFNAGWEEISAAAGWNFVAAEEYGRWVCPGGNSFLCEAMWRELSRLDQAPPHCPSEHLRARCRVVDVRLLPGDRVQVTYRDAAGVFRSLRARRVVVATPKHVARHFIHDLATLDPQKHDALGELNTRSYVVANVLIDAPLARDFYDLFLLNDPASFPQNETEAEAARPLADAVNAGFPATPDARRAILTLYWAVPYNHGRFHLIFPNGWQTFAEALVPQLRRLLQLLEIAPEAVRQVRMTRWGHAMPIAQTGFIANGAAGFIRRPIEDRIYFVNQDNWALPAVETCLLEAEHFAPLIEAGLG